MSLFVFDSTKERIAVVTHDSKIRIYDTGAARLRIECTEPHHLAVKYTSLAWGQVLHAVSTAKTKKRKVIPANVGQNAIVAGTVRGDLVMWNAETAEIIARFGSQKDKVVDSESESDSEENSAQTNTLLGHNAPIVSVSWNNNRIVSLDEEGVLIEWDIETKAKNTRVELNHPGGVVTTLNEFIVATTNSIKLLSPQNLQTARKFKGHNTVVRFAAVIDNPPYLLTATKDDRFIMLWDCSSSSLSVVAKETFVADDIIVSLEAISVTLNRKTALRVLCLTRNGEMNIWDYCLSTESEGKTKGKKQRKKPLSPMSRMIPKGLSKANIDAVTLASDSVAIVFVNSLIPIFKFVNYTEHESGKLLQNVDIVIKEEKDEEMKQKETVKDMFKIVDSFAEISARSLKSDQIPESFIPSEDSHNKVPATSLANALDLILTTNDKRRENEILSTNDQTIISNTIQRLTPVKAEKLLSVLVTRMKTHPNNISATVIWLKTLLSFHLSLFLKHTIDVQQQIKTAQKVIESRMRTQNKLQSVSGRLNLIITQINKSSNAVITRDFNDYVEGKEDEEDEDEEFEEFDEELENEEEDMLSEEDDDEEDDMEDSIDED